MSFRRKLRVSWLAIALAGVAWVGLTGVGFAQSMNAGDIRGVVTDVSGAILPDVTVTVVNKNTGVTKILTTNQDGLFDTASIVAGTYEITFSKPGFKTSIRSSLTIDVGDTTVNAQLEVGAVTEQVVVNTDIPLLSTENAEQSTTLTATQLSQLPQVGQDWQNFTILLPGGSGAPMADGSQGAGNPGQVISVNGNLPYSTVLADGAAITLPSSANADVMVLDTIQEVKIGTSNFSAQYGVGGIMFNQISKGGTDRFHGDVYEFFQNDALNAANYAFSNVTRREAISHLRYNNFGFSIGGPVLKRKLFFFFNYDKIKNPGASTPTFTTVPTAAMLSGDFTGQATVYDPATTRLTQATGTRTLPNGNQQTCPCYDRTSFADEYGQGNKIPAFRFDSLAQNLQPYYPTPNTPGTVANGLTSNNFLYNIPNANPFTKFFGRMDYDIRGNNRLTATVQQSDNPAYNNGQGICPINCQSGDVSRYNAQITDVWTISPNVINELRVGYTNQLNFFVPASLNQGFPAKLGWQYAKADIFPQITINGYYQLTSNINAVYKEHVYDPSDVVTLIRGKHILHFGGEFLFFRDNSTAWGNITGGNMGFTGQYTASTQGDSSTGLAYADFLLGQMQNWNAQVTPEFGGRMRLPQLFAQDDYKLTPNLTLNLGLRYQIQSGWGEVKGNMATFDPTVQNPVSGTLGAMWFGSTQANGRSRLQSPVYTTVLPRVGFSWLMRPNATLRGGFGLYAYNWSLDAFGGSSAGPAMGGAFGSRGSVTDTTNGVTPVGILGGDGANLPYIAASTDPAAFNGTNVNYIQYHAPVGGSYQWNISVQEELTPDLVTELSYVGSHGHDLPFPVDINQVPENKLGSNDITLRPYPQFGHLLGSTNNAISNYSSLQAVIQKRMSHGLDFNFNYVWAHFLSDMDSSGWGGRAGAKNYQRSFDPSANYGNSNFDVRNAFKGSVLYQLPFGKGRAFVNNSALLDTLIGGWQTSGTLVVQSGQPFTVSMKTDNSFAQSENSQWYPNIIGNPKLSTKGPYHGTNQWFNEAAFAVPAPGTFGNAGRNILNGPGLSQVNFSLGKTFSIWESVKFQLRADANNIFNHPSFNLPTTGSAEQGSALLSVNPDGTIATGTSTIRGVTVDGRTMQLSGRISF
jgi:Carboxypeptidase regulatory-like domain/TonB dependent receptor